MIRFYVVVRVLLTVAALLVVTSSVLAQDVGGDAGGGAGIFRPKNPVAKRTTKPTATGGRTSARTTRPPANAAVNERFEEMLAKGNDARDGRKFAEAEEAYQGAAKLKPRDARAVYGLGNVYADQQRWENAETAYRSAVEFAPKDVDALVALSVVLTQPRVGADNAKRYVEAESFARRAVQIDPKHAVAWDRLGVALQSRGLLNSETEHSYRRAIDLDPQFAVAYAHLARALNRLGRSGEAVPLYAKATELAKDPATLNLIAESLQAEQLWKDSEPVLTRALELDSRNPTSLILMGRYLVVFKRYQDAEPYLRQATEVSPKAFQPFNLLARTYLGMERLADAESAYDRAAQFASETERKQLAGIFGFEGLGDGYMKAKQKESAARAYQRALELDPGNRTLGDKLTKARLR
ncbi:MAG TPA: tetratricopeptide repeat protein [Pyrinomonadaceae bacterium]|nr:tetratricopeptide repeat protein [Pyrinomonadaceae bacterium]